MKKSFSLALIVLGLCIYLIANAQESPLKQFNFMLGYWEMKTPKGKMSENWHQTPDGFEGKSYRHDLKGDSTMMESVVLKKVGKDFLFTVTGMEENNTGTTTFRLIPSPKNRFIFENKAHDFPQRIVYENQGKDKLLAWIEGSVSGKLIKSEFNYKRKKY